MNDILLFSVIKYFSGQYIKCFVFEDETSRSDGFILKKYLVECFRKHQLKFENIHKYENFKLFHLFSFLLANHSQSFPELIISIFIKRKNIQWLE